MEDRVRMDRELAAWRKAERARLIEARLAMPAERRAALSEVLAARLEAELGAPEGRVAGFYWPFRGELDLRPFIRSWTERGGAAALPVVIAKATPLEFRRWAPGDKLEKGVWNIPVPAGGAVVGPAVVISPLVGFDGAGYRLGYGGGFYDRTLQAMAVKPLGIGVGYELSRLPSIRPQWHDVPMDRILVV